jgi:catechol 2,3-dioxygenase-like lactoylglutathione lyase family enzyme
MRCLPLMTVFASGLFAQLAPPNDAGVSLGHLHLIVADPAVQKKLWMDVLGADDHAAIPNVFELLKLPGIDLVIGKAASPRSGGTDGSSVAHIGFAVKDLNAVKAKLDAAKVEYAAVNGNPKQIMAKFPDQVTVELTQDEALGVPVAMHHIHLATPDPEKLRGWYVKTFGARAGTRGNFLAAFIPGGEVDTRKADALQQPTKGRSLDHIGFEVKNLEAFCKKLESSGVQFEIPYRVIQNLNNLKVAFLIDPEGTRIELTEGLAGR